MRSIVVISALMLAGCQAATPGVAPQASAQYGPKVISPEMAILAAADQAPHGYPGRFGMTVVATGREKGRLFLNSREDYRDPRNITIAIDARAQRLLRMQYKVDSFEHLVKGRQIEVDGVAMKERIIFTAGGRPSGKYYYQTHVRVSDPDQIRILDVARPDLPTD